MKEFYVMAEFISNFHFIRPWFFLLLMPLAWILWRGRDLLGQANSWQKTIDPALLPFLLSAGQEQKKRSISYLLIPLVGVLSIISLAGPAWQKIEQPVYRDSRPLVIAFDLSRSMESTDIKPNRISKAKYKLLDLLAQRKEGQTALLVYAAQPFAVVPLTEDAKTIASLVPSLETNMMPSQGSNAPAALQKAFDLLQQAHKSSGDILFITDGIDQSKEFLAIYEQAKGQYRVSIMGVGTKQGAPIPDQTGQFIKNQQGQVVLPKLAEKELQTLANKTGGRYSTLTINDQDINYLNAPLLQKSTNNPLSIINQNKSLVADLWYEAGAWLILLIIPLVLLVFRRGYLILALVIFMPLTAPPVDAFSWDDLWLNADQQGKKQLSQNQPKEALKTFQDPKWKAGAAYQAGDYQKTLDNLKEFEQADDFYNKGNALARLGKYKEAIENYKKALAKNPADQDAKDNKKLLEDLLKQQKKKEDKNKQNKKDQKENKDQKNKDQKNKDQQDKEQKDKQNQKNSKDQQNKDQKDQSQQKSKEQQEKEKAEKEKAEKEKQKEQQKEQAKQQKAEEKKDEQKEKDKKAEQMQKDEKPLSEEEKRLNKITEQWLKRIPDDPAGLLRRKFKYQYQRQYQGQSEQNPW